MEKKFRLAIENNIAKAKCSLLKNFALVQPNLKKHMDDYLSMGYYGWGIVKNPFLWKVECKDVIDEVEKEVNRQGYELYMNSLCYTVFIVPSKKFGIEVKDCFVGCKDDINFNHYTIDDEMDLKLCNNFHNITNKIKKLENKIDAMWYAPGMPGYECTKKNFEKNVPD